MENFIINIGLNVGYREPVTQLNSVIYHLNNTFVGTFKDTLKEENNGSCWGKERVLIVEGETDLDAESFSKVVQELCYLMRQQAMPFCLGEYSELVYSETFEGERCSFQDEYFLRK